MVGLSFTPGERDRVAVVFVLDGKEKVTVNLPSSALWSLADLMTRQAQTAEWELSAPGAKTDETSAAASEPRRLN